MAQWNDRANVPTRAVGRTRTSILQVGWWQAGGPPYFPLSKFDDLVAVRRICAQRGVTNDCAPAYGKGSAEMLMYLTYCYLEDEWRGAGLKLRREGDPIFSKCGLYWPRDSLMATHADMHRSPDRWVNRRADEVTPDDVKRLILSEFEQSCVRMNVDYIHGYMLHWPLTKAGAVEPAIDWMTDGVLAAFAQLWRDGKVGAVGFANVDLSILARLQSRAKELATQMGAAGDGFAVHFIQNDRSMLGVDVHGGEFGKRDIVRGELAEFCKRESIARMAYSSLGHGPPIPPAGPFIYVEHWTQPRQQQLETYEYRKAFHERFAGLAREIGCSSPQMALAWLMSRDIVPVFSATTARFAEEDIDSVNFIDAVLQAEDRIGKLCEEYRQGLWEIIRRFGTKAKW